MPLVPLGQLGLDEIRTRPRHHLALVALAQLDEERLVAPDITRFQQRGADSEIGFGEPGAFVDRAGGMADLQPHVPKDIEHELDHLLAPRRLLVGQQEHEVDVGKGRQFATPITAERHQRQPLAGGRIGHRIDPGGRDVVEHADQLVHRVAPGRHHLAASGTGLQPLAQPFAGLAVRLAQQFQQLGAEFAVGGRVAIADLQGPLVEVGPIDDALRALTLGHAIAPFFVPAAMNDGAPAGRPLPWPFNIEKNLRPARW